MTRRLGLFWWVSSACSLLVAYGEMYRQGTWIEGVETPSNRARSLQFGFAVNQRPEPACKRIVRCACSC
jgi:hypothetical protein